MHPYKHAELSAKRYGGTPEDYLDIHLLLDSSKETFPDNRHRILTHNSWFVGKILPLIFGHVRYNSDKKQYSVKDVGEFHVLEDYKFRFYPSVQDYIENLVKQPWMDNGMGVPNRCKNIFKNKNEMRKYLENSNQLLDEELEQVSNLLKLKELENEVTRLKTELDNKNKLLNEK